MNQNIWKLDYSYSGTNAWRMFLFQFKMFNGYFGVFCAKYMSKQHKIEFLLIFEF